MNDFIPLSIPSLKGNELKYLTECIESEFVSSCGAFVSQFETNIASYVNIPHAIACMNGTAALHISLLLSGVNAGDEVIVPTLTFIAPINTVTYVGADPVFMDCDNHLNLDPQKLKDFCENECDMTAQGLKNKRSGKLIKAIMVVHVFGNLANMESLSEIATKYHLKLIEDATESLGSYYKSYKGTKQFAGTVGDFACLSFNGNKIITSGGGGMILTKDKDKANLARHLTTQAKQDHLFFKHDQIGFNYRMTNLQAAVGLAQLEKLDQFIQIKRENFLKYQEALSGLDKVEFIEDPKGTSSNYWYYGLVINNSDRDKLLKHLDQNNIQARPVWALCHQQTPYEKAQAYRIEKAPWYEKRVLNIPCSVSLKDKEILKVSNTIREFFGYEA